MEMSPDRSSNLIARHVIWPVLSLKGRGGGSLGKVVTGSVDAGIRSTLEYGLFCTDLRRLARLRLRRGDVGRAVSQPSVLQRLLHRWRGELSCALVLGDADVFLASLQGSGVGDDRGLAPADVH
eukprot:gene15461-biopygen7091